MANANRTTDKPTRPPGIGIGRDARLEGADAVDRFMTVPGEDWRNGRLTTGWGCREPGRLVLNIGTARALLEENRGAVTSRRFRENQVTPGPSGVLSHLSPDGRSVRIRAYPE